jgi:pyruvate kinase
MPETSAGRGGAPQNRGTLRRTKIVATIGPASESEAVLRQLIAAGMNVARLNFSHGTHAEHGRTIRLVRRLAREAGVPIAILQDLQGPKIRVGRLPAPVDLREGATVVLTPGRTAPPGRVPVPFAGLYRAVRPGSHILMKDGSIEVVVTGRRGRDIVCRIVRGGLLGAHQGVNLPGIRIHAPSLTRKDAADLRFGIRQGVDAVALSFVRTAEDVRRARGVLRRLGRVVPIVAKLEKAEAITNLAEIVEEADAVMVARGDLGVELPAERVPLLQKRIIRRANERCVPVITATQMLESMVRAERPTRAETSDVANAVLDGTDAVMLSAETAAGRHPVEAVAWMAEIASAVEDGVRPFRLEPQVRDACSGDAAAGHDRANPRGGTATTGGRRTVPAAISAATQALTEDLAVAVVVALTTTGRTAELLSQRRLPAPVLACTEDERLARLLSLWWGVAPLLVPFQPTTEAMIAFLDRELVRRQLARPGDPVVVVGSVPVSARGRTNFVQVHRISRIPAGRRSNRSGGLTAANAGNRAVNVGAARRAGKIQTRPDVPGKQR